MKNSNAVWLSLEVLEDRMALSGAFGGAIQAGIPLFPPIPGLTAQATNFVQPQSSTFRDNFAGFNSQALNPVTALQSQLQSFQAAQTAAIDQYFSDLQSLFQQLNLKTFLII